MTVALIILHEVPEAANPRADTAIRLAGAMLAEGKDVRLFLVGPCVRCVRSPFPLSSSPDSPLALLRELLELGLTVQCCGSSLKCQGLEDRDLPKGITRSSMKGLSAWISAADEVVSF
ncbi:MAG: DsrE family protein [Acidiferrobacter sp.]